MEKTGENMGKVLEFDEEGWDANWLDNWMKVEGERWRGERCRCDSSSERGEKEVNESHFIKASSG